MIKSKDKKKNDLLLGAVLLLTATVLFLGRYFFREEGGAVRIMVADQEFGSFSLMKTGRSCRRKETFSVSVMRMAFTKWADRPDQLCVHQGKISRKGETIACLPNRVTVRVTGGTSAGTDSIAG